MAVGIALLLVGITSAPGAVAAQGRLEARATVISASALREGLAFLDSGSWIGFAADSVTPTQRIDGPLTSLFLHPGVIEVEGRPVIAPSPSRTDHTSAPRLPVRVARVLEIHYLRN